MAYEDELDGKLKALTAKEIGAAMKKYVDPSKLALVKAGDFKPLAPPK
jgi:zinc protease